MASAAADALRDYQAAAMRISEARIAGQRAAEHLGRCRAAEREAIEQAREAVWRLGSDPLRLLPGARGGAAGPHEGAPPSPAMQAVLDALPGTTAEIVQRTGLRHKTASNTLGRARALGRVTRNEETGVWRAA